jgi:hypothetical protein
MCPSLCEVPDDSIDPSAVDDVVKAVITGERRIIVIDGWRRAGN